MSSDSEYSESDYEGEYELCCSKNSGSCGLPFEPSSIEKIILSITDKFNFRVILNDGRAKKAILVTTGLTLAGALIGRQVGGKVGAAVGGAVGGVCGLGVVVVSMREIWNDVKEKLWELFDIVYDYIAGLGIDDYKRAAKFLMHGGDSTQLAMMILQFSADVLGKQIMSNITAL